MLAEHKQLNKGLASAETMDTIEWVDRQLRTMKYEKNKNERNKNEECSRDEDIEKIRAIESRLNSTDK